MPGSNNELLVSPRFRAPTRRQLIISDIALLLQHSERLKHVSRHDVASAKPLPPFTQHAN